MWIFLYTITCHTRFFGSVENFLDYFIYCNFSCHLFYHFYPIILSLSLINVQCNLVIAGKIKLLIILVTMWMSWTLEWKAQINVHAVCLGSEDWQPSIIRLFFPFECSQQWFFFFFYQCIFSLSIPFAFDRKNQFNLPMMWWWIYSIKIFV